MFFIPNVPAGATGILNFIFHVPVTQLHECYQTLRLQYDQPISNSNVIGNIVNNKTYISNEAKFNAEPLIECLTEIRKVTGDELLDQFAKLDPTGLAGCYM